MAEFSSVRGNARKHDLRFKLYEHASGFRHQHGGTLTKTVVRAAEGLTTFFLSRDIVNQNFFLTEYYSGDTPTNSHLLEHEPGEKR